MQNNPSREIPNGASALVDTDKVIHNHVLDKPDKYLDERGDGARRGHNERNIDFPIADVTLPYFRLKYWYNTAMDFLRYETQFENRICFRSGLHRKWIDTMLQEESHPSVKSRQRIHHLQSK
jgi:hypothetical protein